MAENEEQMNPLLYGFLFGLGLCLSLALLKIIVVAGVCVIALLGSAIEKWRDS
jgi:hypothetical protein